MKKYVFLWIFLLIVFFVGCSSMKPPLQVSPQESVDIVAPIDPTEMLNSSEPISLDTPEKVKAVIENTSNTTMQLIRDQKFSELAKLVHPIKGVRFTPYTYVSIEDDIVLPRESIKDTWLASDTLYTWGVYDGIGDDIVLTPMEYYERFIYSADFASAEEVGYNEVLSSGNMLENQFEVYDDPIIVEYYFPYFDKQYEGTDWKSLRLVFEYHEDAWYLVGIIHNQWTI